MTDAFASLPQRTSRQRGVALLLTALLRDPRHVADLPRWVRERDDRLDPLSARKPWWNYKAIAFVEERLRPGMRIFEYGGGASTLWLLDRGCFVRAVEHDPGWHIALSGEVGPGVVKLTSTEHQFQEYVNSISSEPDGSLDLVIVDGRKRVRCGLAAAPKLKPGGMLLLDDSERPKYARLHEALQGWQGHHLLGLKTGDWEPRQTSVWIKPRM